MKLLLLIPIIIIYIMIATVLEHYCRLYWYRKYYDKFDNVITTLVTIGCIILPFGLILAFINLMIFTTTKFIINKLLK